MERISILGHFAHGKNSLNGQTVKTKIVAGEIAEWFGNDQVDIVDTAGGWRFFARSPYVIMKMMLGSGSIVIMPGSNGLRVLPLLICFWSMLLSRRLYYVVIGGWLHDFVSKHKHIAGILKGYDGIFVETDRLRRLLEASGFSNVYVMPNGKPLNILSPSAFPSVASAQPFRLCTFSRVIKEKGIADAISAVGICNARFGKDIVHLDIYGPIDDRMWFEPLMSRCPDYVNYCGTVDYNRTVDTLKDYYALLFPTYYEGECFPGSLIDAMAAGVPVIASDWHDNPDIVDNEVTGLLFPTHDVNALADRICRLIESPEKRHKMSIESLRRAKDYLPENAFKVLKTIMMK